jgi:hypothetical protein
MKLELIIIGVTIFFVLNTYSDGKFVKIVKSWKKYYQMAGIGFIGLSAYIFMKKYPSHSSNLLCHANGLIKYLPIDKEASDLLSPLLDMSKGGGGGLFNRDNSYSGANISGANISGANTMMSPQERRILSSGTGTNANTNANTGAKATKRSVSETKKKYVAAQQGWNCGGCKKQLPAWFEVDHKIRLDNGGSNSVDNLVALCRDCHGKKTAFENL